MTQDGRATTGAGGTERADAADRRARRADEAVLLVAGAVDLVLERAEETVRQVRSLLTRSDLGTLAQDLRRDLVARGRTSGFDPVRAVSAPPHLELLAQRARTRLEREGRLDRGPAGDGAGRTADGSERRPR
ncbi:hypothetical protein ACWD6I_30240 [Streptomyces sp. NPDC002454]